MNPNQQNRSQKPDFRSQNKNQKSGNQQRFQPRNNKRDTQTGQNQGKKGFGQNGATRGAAIRASRRISESASKVANQYLDASQKQLDPENRGRANVIKEDPSKLKITILGGLEDVGEKNMMIIENQTTALVVDCGLHLGIELPGVNYEIVDPAYLETIKHKIKGYAITHGHLDHIGGLKFIVPKYPAPIFGSRFTIGVVEKTFEDVDPPLDPSFKLQTVVMNMDAHERLIVGDFTIEFLRITHSIPEASSLIVDTPVGRILCTGDLRLDPEPLDHLPSDIERLRKIGDEGLMLLVTESTYSNEEGRTPTEHTLQQSFHDIIGKASGRIFVSVFSSNMNRIQMVVNAAVEAGRKAALDGRSMMAYAEIAVRQGLLKVPKGTFIAMKDVNSLPDDQVLVMCTGGQGEPGSALQRMSEGDHKFIKLKEGDTVVVSSSPIPGNEVRYDQISNNLAEQGCHLFRHVTYEVDGCGPLHVSGHGRRDEMREMIELTRPKFVLPNHAGMLRRKYHADVAVAAGVKRENVMLLKNGDSILVSPEGWEPAGQVPHGSMLVDQNGSLISNIVVKDRLMLSEQGVVAVVLTIDKRTGQLMTSPDIISRGFIYMRDSEELMNNFRVELRRVVAQRYKRVDLERFKTELREHVTYFLYEQTQRSPIVIPVVNVIGTRQDKPGNSGQTSSQQSPEEIATEQQKRFAEMRARLLGTEAKED